MRKAAVFIAVICCFSVFTACGSNKSSSPEEKASPENPAAVTAGNDISPEEKSGYEFAESIRKFFSHEDPVQMLDETLPGAVVESMKDIGAIQTIGETMEETFGQAFEEIPDAQNIAVEYISERECDPAIIGSLEKLYSVYYVFFKTMNDNGISYQDYLSGNVGKSEMEILSGALEDMEKIGSGEDVAVEVSIKLEGAKFVTVTINGDPAEFLFYKVTGENWRLDTMGLAVLEY